MTCRSMRAERRIRSRSQLDVLFSCDVAKGMRTCMIFRNPYICVESLSRPFPWFQTYCCTGAAIWIALRLGFCSPCTCTNHALYTCAYEGTRRSEKSSNRSHRFASGRCVFVSCDRIGRFWKVDGHNLQLCKWYNFPSCAVACDCLVTCELKMWMGSYRI